MVSTSTLRLFTSSAAQIGPSKKTNKPGVPGRSHLQKRTEYEIMIDGINMTPHNLYSVVYGPMSHVTKRKQDTVLWDTSPVIYSGDILSGGLVDTTYAGKQNDEMTKSISKSIVALGQDDSRANPRRAGSIDKNAVNTKTNNISLEPLLETAPSAFYLPVVPVPKPLPVSYKILITIKETPTFLIMDRPSLVVEVDTIEAELVEKDNSYYEYITIGKGRNRKIAHAEMQTVPLLQKQQETNAARRPRVNAACHATTWHLFDAYNTSVESEPAPLVRMQSGSDFILVHQVIAEGEAFVDGHASRKTPAEQFDVIARSAAFLDAVTVMERVLASNVFEKQQKVFKGLSQQDPLRLDVDFKYTLNHLWTFCCAAVEGRCVTVMRWNSVNKNLVAVGYGKFHYSDVMSGVVCCWSVKNPTQPERTFHFDAAVTSLDFSRDHPSLLAVAFDDGAVVLVDISCAHMSVIARSKREVSPSYEPVWQIRWFHATLANQRVEQLLTVGQDGRICKYGIKKEFTCVTLTRLMRIEGNIRGIEPLRKCNPHDIPVSLYPAASAMALFPQEDAYLVAGDSGVIHKCSTDDQMHSDMFHAHSGPVYSIEFSPFCKRLFLTCGADWSIRLWADEVFEPLITLTTALETVQGAVWSPINATVIASIAGNDIHMWDVRRKTFVPASTTGSPGGARNTVVQFTELGDNLLVGDTAGGVHVFALTDMPFSPFYQEEALVAAIMKALITRKELVTLLKKSGEPFGNS